MTIKPDLKTRESVMFAGGQAQFAVTSQRSGKTVYVCSRAWNQATRDTCPFDEATHAYFSERGYGTPQLATYNVARGGLSWVACPANDPHIWALLQVINRVNGSAVHPGVTIAAEDKCCLCGRRLVDPVSIARGIGPDCAGKPTGTKLLHFLEMTTLQLA